MKHLKAICQKASLFLGLYGAMQLSAQAQTLCVFDWGGLSGDIVQLMKNYAVDARGWKANISLIAYKDEVQAMQDFEAGKCDGIVATAFANRRYNNYVSSLSAIGAIPSTALARSILALQASSRLEPEMLQNGYEAIGVIPGGQVYVVIKDRRWNTLDKAKGKHIGVWSIEPIFTRMAQQVGAVPVAINTQNAATKLKSTELDGMIMPPSVFQPLEVYRNIGQAGGVVKFPIGFLTMNMIIKPQNFPAGFGKKSRTWFAAQSGPLMTRLTSLESQVPQQYWIDIPSEDKVAYIRIQRQMRLEFMQSGEYNAKMLSLLKRLRCQQDPSSFECPLKGE